MNLNLVKKRIKALEVTASAKQEKHNPDFPYLPIYDQQNYWRSKAHYRENEELSNKVFAATTNDNFSENFSNWYTHLRKHSIKNPNYPPIDQAIIEELMSRTQEVSN